MLQSFYRRHRVEQSQMAAFQEFAMAVLKTPMFSLDHTLTYKTLGIEEAGQVFFEFVDMTNPEISAKKKQENIVEWLGTLSSSLR